MSQEIEIALFPGRKVPVMRKPPTSLVLSFLSLLFYILFALWKIGLSPTEKNESGNVMLCSRGFFLGFQKAKRATTQLKHEVKTDYVA